MEKQTRRQLISSALHDSLKLLAISSGLTGLLSSSASAELFGSVPEDMPDGRSVYRLTGRVWINSVPATIESFIGADALIKTGDKSEIIFVVGDDAHIVRSNTEIQLQGRGALETGLKVITGKILSVFGKRKPTEQVMLSSSTATIGIRGTGVYIESEQDRSYVCTCYGEARIDAVFGQESETVRTQHHDEPRYVYSNSENVLIQKAPVINHSDDELALIEAIVGRTPPFPNFKESYNKARRKY